MDDISDRFIICGYGRIGQYVAHELCEAAEPYVVLDSNPAALEVSNKLLLAGASRAIDPYSTAGRRMARLALEPRAFAS